MNKTEKEWARKTLKEFEARKRHHRDTAARRKIHGDYTGHIVYSASTAAWYITAAMLEYLLEGNYDCLKEFLTTEDANDE